MNISNYFGEASALCAALFWAVATVLYARLGEHVSALKLNLLKNVLAAIMLLLTLWASGSFLPVIGLKAGAFFVLSGAVGIGIGDTAYFGALRYIGARRALLLLVLSPPLTALIALGLLGESLRPWSWLGIAITIAGVAWVITERVAGRQDQLNHTARGVVFGLVAVLGQSAGSILARMVFLEDRVSPLTGAIFRLLGGLSIVLMGLPFERADAPANRVAGHRHFRRLDGVLVGLGDDDHRLRHARLGGLVLVVRGQAVAEHRGGPPNPTGQSNSTFVLRTSLPRAAARIKGRGADNGQVQRRHVIRAVTGAGA